MIYKQPMLAFYLSLYMLRIKGMLSNLKSGNLQ